MSLMVWGPSKCFMYPRDPRNPNSSTATGFRPGLHSILNPQMSAQHSRDTRPFSITGTNPGYSFNMEKDALRVESESGKGKVIIAEVTGLSLQTWNNIVINYDAGTMDVFLNGELIGSHPGISPFMQFEEVVAGKTRGLEGGICNVVYHPEPLSKSRITMGYRMLRDRFPPTSG